MKSCGSRTRATRSAGSGSTRRSHIHEVAVNDATGTLPRRVAAAPGPPSSSTRRAASGAERVSFQSVAGRSAPTLRVEHHEAVLLARDRDRGDLARAARLVERPRERAPPELGVGLPRAASPVTTWGDWPWPTMVPLSGSTSTTLVDWVEQSMPATREGTGA